jgi:hypothetical protein
MKTRIVLSAIVALAIGGVSACQKKSDVNTSYSTVTSKADLIGRQDFAIPFNADSPMADKKPVVFLYVTTTKSGTLELSPGALAALNNFIEAELPRLKRFTYQTFFNTAANDQLALARDAGVVERPAEGSETEKLKSPDLILNISLDVQSSLAQFGGRIDPSDGKKKDTVASYRVVANCSLANTQRQVISSRNFSVLRQRDVIERILPTGERRFVGGFDPSNSDNLNSVLQDCGREILANLTMYLGESYPITGNITAASGGRMTMNKSADDGMTNETQVLIWATDRGISYGIAYANCEARSSETGLNIYAWNTRDQDAARIVREVQNNPDAFRTMRLRATTIGLPVPMQWQEGRAE